MEWISFPDDRFVVNGLPWFAENSPQLWRLPGRLKTVVREPVWWLATNPSGGRFRFRTNAASLGIRLRYPNANTMNNMCLIGQMGVDLYADSVYWRSVFPAGIAGRDGYEHEGTYFENAPAQWREICLYLPLYAPVEVLAVGVNEEAEFAPPAPFAVERPVAFYGSSITQGGCASRPGMSYQAILGRMLNVDFVNLGFSGNGLGEPELADAMAEIEASCYVVDFAQNVKDVEGLRKVYAPFLARLRQRRPDVPVICNTPIYATPALWYPETTERLEGMRQVIRDAVAERKAAGDTRISLTEGTGMIGPNLSDAFVDGAHPTELGFVAMAKGFKTEVGRVLGLS